MLKVQTAVKPHRCDTCGHRIPIGVRYWRDWDERTKDVREHTNCLDFETEPVLPAGFNQNRRG